MRALKLEIISQFSNYSLLIKKRQSGVNHSALEHTHNKLLTGKIKHLILKIYR